MFDVIIIGGGIIGCTIARELSKYDLNTMLLEKSQDLSEGASKANSGIVHAGYDCEPDTLKAKFNLEGNKIYEKLAKELDIPFERNGSMVLAFSEQQHKDLLEIFEKGKKNGVVDISILNNKEILNMEKNIKNNVFSALYAPAGGIVSPYEATIAFAENAFTNGVQFNFETEVVNILKQNVGDGSGFRVVTNAGEFLTKIVINAAGVYSDVLNNYVSSKKYKIIPRKGEYLLFDKSTSGFVEKTIFQVPYRMGKGILITKTVHGNLLVGPSSEDMEDKTNKKTHTDTISNIVKGALNAVESIPHSKTITSFVGLRATLEGYEDFVVGEAEGTKGFINALGINSPGLSAAPAIARHIGDLVAQYLQPNINSSFISRREGIVFLKDLDEKQQNKIIKNNSNYGKIVCRCETITEGEIVDSIKRPLGATTLDGVKRRTRAGMGRCQSGFCSGKAMEILARELEININEVTKFGGNSKIIMKD